MKLLKLNSTGNDVKKWQYFLTGQGFLTQTITGNFNNFTHLATIAFQTKHHLKPDGVVGNITVGTAMLLGFGVVIDVSEDLTSDNFPLKPNFEPITGNINKQNIFGLLAYKSKPLADNPENITITNNWEQENIVKVKIPQLIPIKGTDTVYFHKKGQKQLVKLWEEWEKEGLLKYILTWEGAYNARFIRGSKTVLSNHAFGTAFDINYAWNKLGAVPALIDKKGCVRQLVKIAHNNGFYWGGHFTRRDGMHFEIAKLV